MSFKFNYSDNICEDDLIIIGFLVIGENKISNHVRAKVHNLLKNLRQEVVWTMQQDNSFVNLIYELEKMEFKNNINIKLNITVGKNININKIISNPKQHLEEEMFTTSGRSINSDKKKKQKSNKLNLDFVKSSKNPFLSLKKKF